MTKKEKIQVTILSESEVESVAPPLHDIIKIVEETFRMQGQGNVEVPTKIGVHPDFPRSFLHAMPAWVSEAGALGLKWISYYPGNFQKGLPDSSAVIILNHPDHGLPVAIMSGMFITYTRTAACAAVAAKYLAQPDPIRLGLVGCGGLGRWSLLALSEVFPSLMEVRVASRTVESRQKFCKKMSAQGPWRLQPVDHVRDAVEGMDIIISSTPHPPEPPIKGEWWNDRTLAIPLDVLNGWDDRAFELVERLVTDNYDGLIKRKPQGRERFRLPERWNDLADIITEKAPGRQNIHERIMAIPTGIASLDMTLGWEVYRQAQKVGLGVKIQLS
jgi:ornithine cyclodeaminase/alanine dehydrogenase-like protein (mu-crystallin family)